MKFCIVGMNGSASTENVLHTTAMYLLFAVHNSRQPLTTTVRPQAVPSGLIFLESCSCAVDGDNVVTSFNETLYEKRRSVQDTVYEITNYDVNYLCVIIFSCLFVNNCYLGKKCL